MMPNTTLNKDTQNSEKEGDWKETNALYTRRSRISCGTWPRNSG